MINPVDILTALHRAWDKVEGVPLFLFVPRDTVPPYGVMQMGTVHAGNGLPAPLFYTEGQVQLDVWSAYEGTHRLRELLNALQQRAPKTYIPCSAGYLWIKALQPEIKTQLPDGRHQWRQGTLNISFSYSNQREES